jgi:hypothetical protein
MVGACATPVLFSQSAPGTVRGVLTDNSGAVIPGASVVISGKTVQKTAGTQVDGSFVESGLPAGEYSIKVAFPGFSPFDKRVVVDPGAQVQVPIQLSLLAERQVVTVQSESAPTVNVDPANNATALVLRGQDLEALPDDPDDLESALLALAGPAAGPNGAQMFVDGFSGGILPPKESIREIRINQNPFSAEYDKLGMGRIEILTKPGSDKFRGSAFMDYGNGVLNSRNPYATNKPPYSNTMYGGTLSGPLGKRASFFINVDQRDIHNNAVIHATTIDPNTFQAVSVNQAVSAPFRNTYVNPRLDYQLTPNNTLVARYQFSTSTQDQAGIGQLSLPSRAYTAGTTEHNGQLTETAVLGANAVNETRFQFSHTNTFQNGDNTVPAEIVSGAFLGGGSQVGNTYNDLQHIELTNFTTVTHNTHTIRFGARLRHDTINNSYPQNFGGTFSFFGVIAAPVLDASDPSAQPTIAPITSLQQYQRTLALQSLGYSPSVIRELGGGASQFSMAAGTPFTRITQFDIAPFFQDDWRARPNLTVSLGMRFEGQTNISDWHDIAPRVGVAWSPRSKNARPLLVIRAGFGVFYERVPENIILQATRFNGVNQQQYVIQNPDFYPNVPSPETLQSLGVPQTWYQLDRDLRAAYLMQSAVSVERQLPKNTTMALSYVNVRSNHLIQNVNINTPYPGTTDQPYPGYGNLFQYESGGVFNQNMMIVTFNSRVSRALTLFGNYSLNFMNSNVDNNGSPSNPYNFALDYGRSILERRHRFQLVGTVGMPLGMRFSPFVIVQSGAPYDLVIGEDLNHDSLPLDRPAFATDLTRKSVKETQFGAFDADPLPGATIVPRNYLTGDSLASLNFRLGRTFGFGSRSGGNAARPSGSGGGLPAGARIGDGAMLGALDGAGDYRFTVTFSAIVANVINHTNESGFVGTLLSPLFGQSTLLNGGFGGVAGGMFATPANNRRLEFQTRISF